MAALWEDWSAELGVFAEIGRLIYAGSSQRGRKVKETFLTLFKPRTICKTSIISKKTGHPVLLPFFPLALPHI